MVGAYATFLEGAVAHAFLAAIGWMVCDSPSFGGALQATLSRADVNAPPERLFALIDDFHGWAKWSPHERDDPAIRRTYSGPVKGKGATYDWDGGTQFGVGHAQIAEADAPPGLLSISTSHGPCRVI